MEEIRLKKREKINFIATSYASSFEKIDIVSLPDTDKHLDEVDGPYYSIAGRLISKRQHGKIIFGNLKDDTGELQICFIKDNFSVKNVDDGFNFISELVDIGDFIGVIGPLFVTKTGEKTLLVKEMIFLSKALKSLPEKFHGIGSDKESQYRQRYLQLLIPNDSEKPELYIFKSNEVFKNFIVNLINKDDNFKNLLNNIIEKRKKYLNEDLSLDYEHVFQLFVKVSKVRDYILDKLKNNLYHYYLAAIFRIEPKLRFIKRFQIINFLRNYLQSYGFIELETPILWPHASGALAKPFVTYHNALDMQVYLRIAPETSLKKAMVGGFEKVFEFARCFRNEGMDPSHLQDFTLLEFYWAYKDYIFLMDFTKNMFINLLKDVFGTTKLLLLDRDGKLVEVDFNVSWEIKNILDLIQEYFPIKDFFKKDLKGAKDLAKKVLNLDNNEKNEVEKLGWGNFIDFIYKKTVRKKIISPTFVVGHPIELSPLARRNDENPDIVDRFQLVINTWEVVNAYSELIDPYDQYQRFLEQAELKKLGDEEAHDIDMDYINAISYGLPPVAGWGAGIDRLAALFMTLENLRDVVLFPLVKPKNE